MKSDTKMFDISRCDVARYDLKSLLAHYRQQPQTVGRTLCVSEIQSGVLTPFYCEDTIVEFTGYEAKDVLRGGYEVFQGEHTEKTALTMFAHLIKNKMSGVIYLTNYKKDGTSFLHRVELHPVLDASDNLQAYISIHSPADF